MVRKYDGDWVVIVRVYGREDWVLIRYEDDRLNDTYLVRLAWLS